MRKRSGTHNPRMLVDIIFSTFKRNSMPQECRYYSKFCKAQVTTECAQGDNSIANIALAHNLIANLVHKWIMVHTQNLALQTALFRLGQRHR